MSADNVHKVDTPANAHDEEVWAACRAQEAALKEHGGLDLLLLGVSSSGRLAFHEPDCNLPEGAHVAFVELDNRTRISAASDFFGVESVPTHAVTISTHRRRHHHLLFRVEACTTRLIRLCVCVCVSARGHFEGQGGGGAGLWRGQGRRGEEDCGGRH
jgi:hypothetical protein